MSPLKLDGTSGHMAIRRLITKPAILVGLLVVALAAALMGLYGLRDGTRTDKPRASDGKSVGKLGADGATTTSAVPDTTEASDSRDAAATYGPSETPTSGPNDVDAPSGLPDAAVASGLPYEDGTSGPPETSGPLEVLFAGVMSVESVKTESVDVAVRAAEDLPGADSIAVLGDVYNDSGNSSDAVKCWRKSLELDPNSAPALNGMAWVAMKKAEYERAVALWRQAIQINPDLRNGRLSLAGALACLGRTEEAIAVLEEDIATTSNPALSYVMLGNQHLLLGQYEQAKAAFSAAVPYASARHNAVYGLATTHARLGQMEKSREYMEAFRKLKAEEMEKLKKRDRAFDDLATVCKNAARTHTDISVIYIRRGRLREAEQLLRRAAHLDPDNVTGRQILASLYRRVGRLPEALGINEELIGIEPNEIGHYLSAGISAAMVGESGKAEQFFRRMIEIAPTKAVGYKELARFYLMGGTNPSEALALVKKAADLEQDADILYVLSWALEVNGDNDGSMRAILRAIDLAPDNPGYRNTYERLSQQEMQDEQ